MFDLFQFEIFRNKSFFRLFQSLFVTVFALDLLLFIASFLVSIGKPSFFFEIFWKQVSKFWFSFWNFFLPFSLSLVLVNNSPDHLLLCFWEIFQRQTLFDKLSKFSGWEELRGRLGRILGNGESIPNTKRIASQFHLFLRLFGLLWFGFCETFLKWNSQATRKWSTYFQKNCQITILHFLLPFFFRDLLLKKNDFLGKFSLSNFSSFFYCKNLMKSFSLKLEFLSLNPGFLQENLKLHFNAKVSIIILWNPPGF